MRAMGRREGTEGTEGTRRIEARGWRCGRNDKQSTKVWLVLLLLPLLLVLLMLLLPSLLQLPLLLLLLPSRFDSVAAADCSLSLPLLMVHGLMCADSWGFFLGRFFTALSGGLTRFLPNASLRCFFRPRVEAVPGGVFLFLCST